MIENMTNYIAYALQTFTRYFGDRYLQYLLFISIAFVAFYELIRHILEKKLDDTKSISDVQTSKARFVLRNKQNMSQYSLLFVVYPILMLLIVFSPPIVHIILYFTDGEIYWRMFWLLFIPMVISFAFTLLVKMIPKNIAKLFCVLFCIAVICFSGKLIFQKENYTERTNWYQLPAEAIQVAQIITAGDEEFVRVAVPESLTSYIRQYDASIYMPYGRNSAQATLADSKIVKELYRLINNEAIMDMAKIKKYMIDSDCNYVVLPGEKPVSQNPTECGFEYVAVTDSYYIFRLP